ncbi:MAG: hypothetical protein JWO69_118, partial [Thermoleophilia bacterium]|nr:hypothetical protein [Thermoleophilia bacterium]
MPAMRTTMLVVAALLLAGCGGDGSSPGTSAVTPAKDEFNPPAPDESSHVSSPAIDMGAVRVASQRHNRALADGKSDLYCSFIAPKVQSRMVAEWNDDGVMDPVDDCAALATAAHGLAEAFGTEMSVTATGVKPGPKDGTYVLSWRGAATDDGVERGTESWRRIAGDWKLVDY